MPDSFDQLAALIRARFSELSPQFQMGAGFLLDHPDEVAVSSMRKVAERAQVQPASLVRLSQQLGFPARNELRNLFVARVRTRPEPLTSRARSLVKSKDALANDLLVAQQHNLEVTAAHNGRAIVEAARLLRRAPHVHVAGFRSCYSVAFGLVYGYRFFRSSVSLLNGEAGTLEMQLRTVERDSATIVISFAPYSVEAARRRSRARKGQQAHCDHRQRRVAHRAQCGQGVDLLARKPLVLSVARGGHGHRRIAGRASARTRRRRRRRATRHRRTIAAREGRLRALISVPRRSVVPFYPV